MTQLFARFRQPDLFSNGAGALLAEVRRHGGGTPPRYIAEAHENDEAEEGPDFSPVRYAENVSARAEAAGAQREGGAREEGALFAVGALAPARR